eukprot:CAMPEP_0176218560 /NCGR_PEP_ID=MMETSP0121_2-20121125/18263_1 /TAXON_ID=160619 /ORGANISM="Kryptoperidinium foliaceum, Strain CCMP 1326" /LENGTH=48 /DNA_ID= /DNA_START= /DNA_END= /DNA_ORIENTATION=
MTIQPKPGPPPGARTPGGAARRRTRLALGRASAAPLERARARAPRGSH